MGWWPFGSKRVDFVNEPHIRGSRVWIQDLREACEGCFDNRLEGQRRVSGVRTEWQSAHSEGEVGEALIDGLERRASRLLGADDQEWAEILDDEGFWKPGWGSSMEEE